MDKLKKEYQEYVSKAARLRESLVEQIGMLFTNNDVTLGVPIESRLKTWSSIEEKIRRKSLKIGGISELSDLVGIRAILLFRRDLALAGDLLSKTFHVVSIEDTGSRLAEAQFGYQSSHYIVQIPEAWLTIPSFADLEGLRAEIQVRTLAQHIWAAASHKLQYKHEETVPPPMRRTIYRVSALLETVDLEFERVLAERQHYVEKEIVTLEPSEPLNVDLVESILADLLPTENKEQPEDYAELLTDLLHFGVRTVNDLRNLLQQHRKTLIAADAMMVKKILSDEEFAVDYYQDIKRAERGVFFTHVGLAREALRKKFGDKVVSNYMSKSK